MTTRLSGTCSTAATSVGINDSATASWRLLLATVPRLPDNDGPPGIFPSGPFSYDPEADLLILPHRLHGANDEAAVHDEQLPLDILCSGGHHVRPADRPASRRVCSLYFSPCEAAQTRLNTRDAFVAALSF